MVPLALGTQTVASVNRPASYCGIAAFKPSTQSNCTQGITPLAPHFDTVGFYGATVADAVALWDAVTPAFTAAFEARETRMLVQLEDPVLESCDAQVVDAVTRASKIYADAGWTVRRARSPEPWAALFETQIRVMQYESSRLYAPLRDAGLGPKLRELIGVGLALSRETYVADRQRLAAARTAFWSAFPDADAILFPAAPQTAPAGLASTGDPRLISPWTALGGAIVTQPAGLHANGLPIGGLVCGAPGHDRALARTALGLDAAWRRVTAS
jgi:aspartyl-tRNA(Asn)/glutamyl-tRNA(Gln) amidotransferase subunit A